MIIRRCSQGHRVRIHRNTTPGATRTKNYPDGSTETLAYPSSYDYFVDVDGSVAKKTNSFKTAEEYYVSECAKKHGSGHGRLVIGTHKVINFIATSFDELPSDSNTKDEIKAFLDSRDISYESSDTKDELLARIP